jgi:uncharacterized membrane protein
MLGDAADQTQSTTADSALVEKGTAAASRLQFSLRHLFWWTTAFCVFLAVPGGYLLVTWLGSYLLTAAALIGLLLLIQWPGYLLVRFVIAREKPR